MPDLDTAVVAEDASIEAIQDHVYDAEDDLSVAVTTLASALDNLLAIEAYSHHFGYEEEAEHAYNQAESVRYVLASLIEAFVDPADLALA